MTASYAPDSLGDWPTLLWALPHRSGGDHD
jgi:hypothetical protein